MGAGGGFLCLLGCLSEGTEGAAPALQRLSMSLGKELTDCTMICLGQQSVSPAILSLSPSRARLMRNLSVDGVADISGFAEHRALPNPQRGGIFIVSRVPPPFRFVFRLRRCATSVLRT